jgi:hypothetical protein
MQSSQAIRQFQQWCNATAELQRELSIGHQIKSIEKLQWIPRIIDDPQHASD